MTIFEGKAVRITFPPLHFQHIKLCIHERATYTLCRLWLINFPRRKARKGHLYERTPGASNSLCVRAKN